MSVLEKRLQVLLDEGRFAQLAHESASTGRSVGAIVRSAIDLHFATGEAAAARSAAARRLLTSTSNATGTEPDWEQSKAALVADLDPAAHW